MPAPTAVDCATCLKRASVPNIHTYGERSSIGNPFDLMRAWLESFVLPIL